MTTLTIAASALPKRAKHRFLVKPHPLAVALTAAACALLTALPAQATDLLHAWQAAQTHDPQWLAAQAAHGSAQPLRQQAKALWRPSLGLSASAGRGYGETQMQGAQFSAPGMGTNNGVDFGTSVTHGNATQIALQASQPLYNPERRAQQQQLNASADIGDLQWQAARQAAMLRTAQQYLDLAVAQEALRVLEQQLAAINRTLAEAQERFDLGAAPITAVHEARAQQAQLQAQHLAAQTTLDVQRRQLHDTTGLPAADLAPHLPVTIAPLGQALAWWQEHAAAHNFSIRLQQRAVEAAQAEASKHRASAAPKLDLVAQAQQQRLSGRGDFGRYARNKDTQALVGVQLTVPLYTGGYRSAKADETQAQAQAAQAQLAATQTLVAQQVHAAWLGEQTGVQQVRALEAALQASAARQEATRIGQATGERTVLDVLHADNDHAATTLALALARSRLLLAQLQLAQLAGTLDEAALQQANQAFAQAPKP